MKKDLLKILGIVAGGVVYLFLSGVGYEHPMPIVAGVITWMAFWWFTEAVELYVTSLIPVVFFPLAGIMSMDDVAPMYMKPIIFLFIGGFLFAYAIERWNLHRRIALRMLLWAKGTPAMVLLGFMLSSYLLSMWIVNTATATMLLPAVLAVTGEMAGATRADGNRAVVPYLLGLTYASSIGGMATVIGTAPNMIFMGAWNDLPNADFQLTFANWAAFGFPVSLVLFVAAFLLLRFLFRSHLQSAQLDMDYVKTSYRNLGKIHYEERWLLLFFVAMVAAWFTIQDINLGNFHFKGWGGYIEQLGKDGKPIKFVSEATVAMLAALVLFFIPARKSKGGYLLTWDDAKRLPVGVIFLFGAGFSMGKAVEVSGWADEVAAALRGLQDFHPLVIVLLACTLMTFFTELASNTATIFLFIPVMFAMAPVPGMHPLQLFLPITLTASCAFMLPVATPPNTIVFGSEKLRIRDMIRAGFWLNLIAILIIAALGYFMVGLVVP